jgi:hypothetical protein
LAGFSALSWASVNRLRMEFAPSGITWASRCPRCHDHHMRKYVVVFDRKARESREKCSPVMPGASR